MADELDTTIDRIDDLLNRAACETVLDASESPAVVRAILAQAAEALAGANLGHLAEQVDEARQGDDASLPAALARIEAIWNGRKARSVAASGADSLVVAPTMSIRLSSLRVSTLTF